MMPSPHRVNNDAIEILVEARTILLENQWGRGAFKKVNSDGVTCYCVAGAVSEAGRIRIGTGDFGAPPLAGAMMALRGGLGWDSVARYNDDVLENRDQAVRWIDQAVEWLKNST